MSNKIVDLVHKINDAFNKQSDKPFKDHVADDVVVHRIDKNGEATPKIGKEAYLAYLKETWERLKNPQSHIKDVKTQQVGTLTKAIVKYDSTFTPPGQVNPVTEPATAIMYFDAREKLVDATYATR